MKSFFSSQFSKFNVLMALCTFGVSVSSIPASASPDQVCTKTSSGEVVCGKPVQNPSSSSNHSDNDETIQTQTWHSSTWELKSCARKYKNITCTISMTSSADGHWDIPVNGTQMVDHEGNEYHADRYQVGKSIGGGNGLVSWNVVQNIKYMVIIHFIDVPTSTPYISLLQIFGTGGDVIKYRDIPIINPDGSFAPVPDSPKTHVSQPSLNNPSSTPKICLPLVGCVH